MCPKSFIQIRLIALDTRVDVLDKYQTELESRSSKHQEKGERNDSHVSKVEGALQNTGHLTSVIVKVERIGVDEKASHTSVDIGCPPPSMVLSRELEVKQRDRNEGRDGDEQDEREQENSEQCVNLMPPHGRKNVVQFNVDSRERKKSCNQYLEATAPVPWHFTGDFTRYLSGACWCVEVWIGKVFGRDSAEQVEWEGNEQEERQNRQDGSEGECTGRAVGDRDRVDP